MILHLIFISILLGPNKKIKCSKNQFSCQNNNQCIDILEYCNNRINCDDESDEINCSTNHCDNYNTNCHKWSLWGYCDKSYKYMLENCRKSCDYCPTTTYTTSNTYTTITTTSNTYTTITTTSNTLTNTYTTITTTSNTLTNTYTTITTTSNTLTNTYTTSNTYTTITTTSNTLTNTYTTITTTSNTLTNTYTTSNTYTTPKSNNTSYKYNASRKIDYKNNTIKIKSKKRKSTSTIIIVGLVICIIFLIFINKKKSIVYVNDINENDINKNNINQPDNFLQNENINTNKPIILDSIYNSIYCNENNEYLVPVVQNYIEEGEYEDII
jgi:hypothetical protein